jgi:fimbrial chaperone protein
LIRNSNWKSLSSLALGLTLACTAGTAFAQGFSALVSPPRFELKGKPGQVLAEAFDISNPENFVAKYEFSTADWTLTEAGSVAFADGLAPDSCRPWTRIERRSLALNARGNRKFRFEVHIPADAPVGECRFAILIGAAPEQDSPVAAGQLKFPVQGRVGLVVYVSVGNAKPKLEFRGLKVAKVNNVPTPVAVFHNSGNAHGRPEGGLNAVDKNGQQLEFVVSPSPILPGQTREVPIWPADPDNSNKTVQFTYPLRLKGTIEWDGGKQAVDATVQ